MKTPRLSLKVTHGVLILHILVVGAASAAPTSSDPPPEIREQISRHSAQLETFLHTEAPTLRRPAPTGVALLDEPGEIPDHHHPEPPLPNPAMGWDPYVGPWTLSEAAHLLHRTVVGPRFEEMEQMEIAGLPGALDALFAVQPLPAPPGPWINDPFPNTTGWSQAQVDSLLNMYLMQGEVLRMWWLEVIVNADASLTETMVHFWHDHFATGMETVFLPQTMYQQNATFREHAMGNFKTLVSEIATDPAMLIWLDGNSNKVGNPNENFARELIELFTMGEGSGYTQADIEEAARAATGWTTDGINSLFKPARFDNGTKTVLGQTGNWDMQDLVDIIFEQDATAEYLCGKLYRWFLDDAPAHEDIAALAQVLRDSNYEVEPVLRMILGSQQFYDPGYRGAVIKDGLDLYGGVARQWHVTGFNPSVDPMGDLGEFVFIEMYFYGHLLFDPPNVAGWPGHRAWINTFTLPIRKFLTGSYVDGLFGLAPLGISMDVMTETARFTDPEDVFALVDDLALLCFGQPPTPLVRDAMVEVLLQGEAPSYWTMTLPDADLRLLELYRFAVRLPDFQLK